MVGELITLPTEGPSQRRLVAELDQPFSGLGGELGRCLVLLGQHIGLPSIPTMPRYWAISVIATNRPTLNHQSARETGDPAPAKLPDVDGSS
jgi:hypothetical protein